jgi:perosamine synthetase
MITTHPPINMFSPYMTQKAINRAMAVLHTPMIGQGKIVDEFESAIQQSLSLTSVVAVNNSSSAIRLALDICGVTPGAEVITTPMTCTLTNHPILEQFALPIFADIQPYTGNIEPTDVEKRITSKTKAILCTHWSGTPSDLDELNGIAQKHGISVIEDASEAFGATYKHRSIGLHSRFVAYSFHAIQIITASEGGALSVQANADYELARLKRWYGIDRVGRRPNILGYYDSDVSNAGYGYYLTNVAAAIGIENLSALSEQQNHRNKLAEIYWQGLKNIPGVTLLNRFEDRTSAYHYFTIRTDRRDDFCRKLKIANVYLSIVHARNDEYTIFGGRRDDLPGLDQFSQSYIIHMGMREEDAHYIVKAIRSGW